jgi:hypothetical protein
MASSSEKPTMDDSASETLKSATPSFNEKAREAEDSVREGSQSPTPEADVSNAEARVSTDGGMRKVHSTTKDAQDELTRVMTSGEGVEYPTGVKLGLISLALCLSVFLMALVCVDFRILASILINTSCYRTIPLLLLLFPRSQINSTPCQMSAGMALPTCLQLPRSNFSSENSTRFSQSNTYTSPQSAFLSLEV